MNEETTHPWILHIISHSKGDGGCWVNYNYFCLCPLGDSELLEGKIRSHSFFWISSIPLLLLDLLCTSSICWKQLTLELRSLTSFLWVRNWRVILLFLAQGLSIILKILARDGVIWRLGWGWRIQSQDDSHIWLASWRWLLARDSVIILASLSPGLLECPHNMDPSWMMKRVQRGRTISFFVLILELILHDFHNILLTISVSLIQCEKGLHKGMDPRIQESFRSKVEADYHVQLEFPSPLIICSTHTQSGTVLPSKHSSHYIIVCSNCKHCEGRDSTCLVEQPAQTTE